VNYINLNHKLFFSDTAKTSRDKPAQIIQDTVTQMPESSHAYMPSKDALRQRIKRVRRGKHPPEPQTLEELSISPSLKITLSGEQFLIRESSVGKLFGCTFLIS